ncbi:AAA family ATPase [Pseudoduganella namucuonensis]|uniref:Predicted ATPase n=1 Tax=Pseudoduganella namucuonensis TaxID=1035707 RepID=A0A1I7LC73_9BURK|nr:AAA family ATPase [Pseudoduganella namucuonensis]SFV07260.1 Predicted ATPase [Pseudoduganella namucuonensis]
MIITNLILKNWRNFREVNVPLRERTYILGANAAGKSNFLDVFRFLRDISKPQGGGLQKAIADRGGVQKLRCLHARTDPEVLIEVHISESQDDAEPRWKYILGFKPEGKGAQRTLISKEQVWDKSRQILNRPTKDDKKDVVRLTQTALEQIQVNSEFRELAEFFADTTYLHLVPQLLKFGDLIGGQRLDDDPFGQGFLERIAKTPLKTRESRLGKIEKALGLAVPQFRQLRYTPDKINGRPHLEAMYSHYRPNAGWQREDQFSDGTLRLLGLLWVLLEGDSLLLLEEPELSLNDGIVREIPLLIQRIQRDRKRRRQTLISTHSEALLSNSGIDGRGVLLLEPVAEGTKVRSINSAEVLALRSGLSVAEVILPKTRPTSIDKLGQWK